MNETFPSSPLWDQMPYYPQTTCGSFQNIINPYDNPFDPTAPYQTSFSPNFTAATEQTTLSREISSCTGNIGEKSAKPSTVAAAARRRSRASKKAPTTLLSTSIANFRAVVQQYTGCRRLASPASFKNRRGPVILSFGGRPTDRKVSDSSRPRCYSDEDRCLQNLQEEEFRQGLGQQQQQRGVSCDNSSHDSYISGVDNDRSCSMLSVDDYEW